MKKYKLIKEYPGSPIKLNTTLNFEKGSDNKYRNYDYNCFEPEKYSEFWEEIKPEYTILIFKDIIDSLSHTPKSLCMSMEECINDKNLKIYTIRRNSDNKIFTIGDKTIDDERSVIIIKKFEINKQNKILVWGDYIKHIHNGEDCAIFLEDVIEYNKPIIVTEDGKKLYNYSEKVFEVILNNYVLNTNIILSACNEFYIALKDRFPSKIFSTEEAALKFIKFNKPLLSISDIDNISESYHKGNIKGRKVQSLTYKYKKSELVELAENKLKENERNE